LIGEISYKLGQLDEAIKEFQQSLNTKHNTTEHSQQETLIDAFHAALHDENKLNEGEIHFILGKCYERKGEKDLSIREFEIAKRLGYQAT